MTSLSLERFDDHDQADPPQSAEFQKGFKAGQAALCDSLQTRQTEELGAISSTLADMTFGFEEARQHLLSALAPLMAQVIDEIIPAILKDTFALHLEDVVQGMCVDAFETPVKINVSPQMFETLSAATLDIPPQFALTADPAIADGQAVITSEHASLIMDHHALFEGLRVALRSPEITERKTDNG